MKRLLISVAICLSIGFPVLAQHDEGRGRPQQGRTQEQSRHDRDRDRQEHDRGHDRGRSGWEPRILIFPYPHRDNAYEYQRGLRDGEQKAYFEHCQGNGWVHFGTPGYREGFHQGYARNCSWHN